MSVFLRQKMIALWAIAIIGLASTANAAMLALDLQPTGGTTAAGFLPLEVDDKVVFPATGTDFAGTEFGTTVNVTLSAANLRTGSGDYRSVARNGAASDIVNDWIGVDARGALNAEFTISVSGLPAGEYNWVSEHHDGGAGATNGNISGPANYSFTDSVGTTAGTQPISQQNLSQPIESFSTSFTSDGMNPVSMTLTSAGAAPIFVFTNSLVISAVPEPGSLMLVLFGLSNLGLIRRR